VAVVQISRIQIRRGRENQGSGVPQLASGEFGWAVDTQKLLIGNGSVAEGAPFVGNTEILTEKSNLFRLADTYAYRDDAAYIQTGPSPNNPVLRTLQARLDDTVSVRAFGCSGDGTDQTAQFQRAIYELFLNDANKVNPQSRVVLYVEPGTYTFVSTIYLPPYVTIKGAGKSKTVFNIAGDGPAFRTINGNSTPLVRANDSTTTESNQARHIHLSDFTITTTAPSMQGFQLESCTRSTFKNIDIIGPWRHGDPVSIDSAGFRINALGTNGVTSSLNVFEDVNVDGLSHSVYSKHDIRDNVWERCIFKNAAYGVHFGVDTVLGSSGQLTGPSANTFNNCIFDEISRQGIWIDKGYKNLSTNNKFYLVGNNGGSSVSPTYPCIEFGNHNNNSDNDWFQRSEELGYGLEYLFNTPYVPEVAGPVITQHKYTQYVRLTELGSYTKIIKFPANGPKNIEVDYFYKSNQVDAVRKGTINITVSPISDRNIMSDNYDFVGNNSYEQSLQFRTENFDDDGDTVVDTVALMVLNSTNNDNADFYFRVKTEN